MRGACATALLVTAATAAGTAMALAGPPGKPPGHTPGQTPGQTGCPDGKPGHTPGQTPRPKPHKYRRSRHNSRHKGHHHKSRYKGHDKSRHKGDNQSRHKGHDNSRNKRPRNWRHKHGPKPPRPPGQTPGHTPGHTPGQTGCPKPGGKKGRPVIKRVKIKPAKFHVFNHVGSVAARSGARIKYFVSEAGTARFTVARRVRGRHHVRLPGSFSHGAVRGRNELHFTGRLEGRALAPGRYKLKVIVVDLTGDVSRTKSARFRILRP